MDIHLHLYSHIFVWVWGWEANFKDGADVTNTQDVWHLMCEMRFSAKRSLRSRGISWHPKEKNSAFAKKHNETNANEGLNKT